MFERRIPEWLRHAPAPSVRGFATLAGLEAVTRGVLISVFPVAMYDALNDAALVSSIYFAIGLASLAVGLLVPFLNKFIPRRVLYGLEVLFYILGNCIAVLGTPAAIVTGLIFNFVATVVVYVCLYAYVLDYISRIELGKPETLRLFLLGHGLGGRPCTWRFLVGMVEAGAVSTFRRRGRASARHCCLYAPWQRQTYRQGKRASHKSAGLCRSVFRAAAPGLGLDICGDTVMRMVGLRGLPSNLCRRKRIG